MNHELKQKAIYLRIEKEFSYNAIRKQIGVAKSTLSGWLKNFPLSKEKILELRKKAWKNNEAKIEMFRATMREKREQKMEAIYAVYRKKLNKLPKEALFTAGLTLYLAEGSKRDYSRLVLANTDPNVIKFFIKWLNDFFAVPREKMKAQLHLYENMNIQKEVEFWKKELNFNNEQFFKNQVRKLQKSSFSYRESFRHGTCSIYFGSVEKKTHVMMAIKAFVDSYLKMGA